MNEAILFFLTIFSMGVVFPIIIVWIKTRQKNNETNRRSEIILAAIEKNPDINLEEFIRKMNPPQKTLKEKLINRVTTGVIATGIGLILSVFTIYLDYHGGAFPDTLYMLYVTGASILMVGVGFLLAFFISKKMLAKELEVENLKNEEAIRKFHE